MELEILTSLSAFECLWPRNTFKSSNTDLHHIHFSLFISQLLPCRQGLWKLGLVRRSNLHFREAMTVKLASQLFNHSPLCGCLKMTALLFSCEYEDFEVLFKENEIHFDMSEGSCNSKFETLARSQRSRFPPCGNWLIEGLHRGKGYVPVLSSMAYYLD